jgi:hypothetical protein
LETFAFDFLSGNGDYLDIKNIVSPEDRPDVTDMSKEELLSLVGNISPLPEIHAVLITNRAGFKQ